MRSFMRSRNFRNSSSLSAILGSRRVGDAPMCPGREAQSSAARPRCAGVEVRMQLPVIPSPARPPETQGRTTPSQTAERPAAADPALAELSARIRARAREIGFDAVGIAPVRPSDYGEAYERWIAAGMHGEMAYLAREDAVAKRRDPAVL